MTTKIEEKLMKGKVQLQTRNSFFGRLILALEFEENDTLDEKGNPINPTIGVDYKGGCQYNSKFINELTNKELVGILAHELLHCFDENAMVGLEDVKIKDIKEKDKVVCDDGKCYNIKKVNKRKYKGNMFNINVKGMLPFNVTPNHRFLVIKNMGWKTKETTTKRWNERILTEPQWIKSQKIKEGDYLLIPKIKPIDNFNNYKLNLTQYAKANLWSLKNKTINLNNDFAYFLGRFTADGWTDKHNKSNQVGIVFNKNKLNQAKKCKEIIEKLGYIVKIKFEKRTKQEEGTYRLFITSIVLKRFIRDNIGTYSNNKTIPSFILYNPNINILKSYLNGLYDGDGYVVYKNDITKKHISYCSVSKQLILRLQKALTRLNTLGMIIQREPINDLVIFGKLLTKKENLKTQYILSVQSKEIFKLRKETYNKKRPTKHHLDFKNHFGVKIKDIKIKKHDGYVYNFSTERENYLVNNMITHNCALLHHFRFSGREPQLSNIAEDICINSMLVKDRYVLPTIEVTDEKGTKTHKVNGLVPNANDEIELDFKVCKIKIKDCSSKNAEMIYEEIIKQLRKNGNSQISLSTEDLSELEGKGKGGSALADGIKEVAKRVFDQHIKIDKGKMSKKQVQKAQKQIEGMVREALEHSRMRGDTPCGLERLWGSIHEEKFNWKTLLQRYITELLPYDQSWRSFGKKSYGTGIYSPMTLREQIDVTIAIDVSGCFSGDTLLYTENGIEKIKNIVKGKLINSDFIKNKTDKINKQFIYKSDTLLNIKTKSGKELNVTPNHKIFVFESKYNNRPSSYKKDFLENGKIIEKRADELTINDYLLTPNKINYQQKDIRLPLIKHHRKTLTTPQQKNKILELSKKHSGYEIAKILKYSPQRVYRVLKNTQYKHKNVILPKYLERNFAEFLGMFCGDGNTSTNKTSWYSQITDKNKENLIYYKNILKLLDINCKITQGQGQRQRLSIYSKDFTVYLKKHFKEITLISKLNEIPKIITRGNDDVIKGFVRGLFDAVGHIEEHALVITSSSKKMLQQTQMLLNRLGIYCYLTTKIMSERKLKDTIIKKSICYQVSITGLENIKLFNKLIGVTRTDKKKKINDYIKSRKLNQNGVNIKYTDDICLEKITYIKTKKMKKKINVYDLEINNNHNYYANGLLVHNSIADKDLTDFISEIVGVANQFKNRIKMTIMTHENEVVDTFSVFSADDVKNIKIRGCGGTSFEPVVEHVKQNHKQTKCLVWLTDGEGEKELERQPFEVIWVLTSDGDDRLCKKSGRVLWLKDTLNNGDD